MKTLTFTLFVVLILGAACGTSTQPEKRIRSFVRSDTAKIHSYRALYSRYEAEKGGSDTDELRPYRAYWLWSYMQELRGQMGTEEKARVQALTNNLPVGLRPPSGLVSEQNHLDVLEGTFRQGLIDSGILPEGFK